MKALILSCCLSLAVPALPAVVSAEPAGDRPPPPHERTWDRERDGDHPGPGGRSMDRIERMRHAWANAKDTPDPTDAEWKEVETFMQEHAPLRHAASTNAPADQPGMRGMMKRSIFARYKALQGLKQDDPELYDCRVKTLEIEDRIWGLLNDLKTATTAADREAVRGKVREQVTQITGVWMKERRLRIDQLELALKKEKERVAADEGNLPKMIDKGVERYLTEGVGPKPGGPPGIGQGFDKPKGDGPGDPRGDRRDGGREGGRDGGREGREGHGDGPKR